MKNCIIWNVAVYIRLSREDGDKTESDSIGNQRNLLMEFIEGSQKFVLKDIYIDDGWSGTNFNRPAFKKMIDDIEEGIVNCVIVKDLSRFGRDYIDTGKYLERYFPEHNIRFISVTDGIDSVKQAYDMLLPIKNIFNEQYARDISKKIHTVVKTKQRSGEFIGAFASYGYKKSPSDKNKLIVDEYAAEVVRKIFRLYINGYGKNSIAKLLNEEGILCPSEYKKINGEKYRNSNKLESTSYWTYSTINKVLHNEMYIGNMVQGKKIQNMRGRQHLVEKDEWIVVENTHEAIIDKVDWAKVQDLLLRRTRNLNLESSMSIFAGYLKCGDCGRALVKKKGAMGSGDASTNYYCGTYIRSGTSYCSPHRVPYKVIESIIYKDLKEIINSIRNYNMEEIINKNHIRNTSKYFEDFKHKEHNKLIVELDKVRRIQKGIYEDYKEELISKEELVLYKTEYNKKEILLKSQINLLEKKQTKKCKQNIFEIPWIEHLMNYKEVECLDRIIIGDMIDSIKVYENNKIKIVYKFSKN